MIWRTPDGPILLNDIGAPLTEVKLIPRSWYQWFVAAPFAMPVVWFPTQVHLDIIVGKRKLLVVVGK
jgi:hypothetical protein